MSEEHVPLVGYSPVTDADMSERASDMYQLLSKRRTVRFFDEKPVPREVIETAIKAAGTAPNGANQQPWHFAAISNPEMKHKIRMAAEEEERAFYGGRAKALLCDRERWHRNRYVNYNTARSGFGDSNAYACTDEFFAGHMWSSVIREAYGSFSCGPSSERCDSACSCT